MNIPISHTNYGKDQSLAVLIGQALKELQDRLDKFERLRFKKKKGAFGLTEPICETNSRTLHLGKILRAEMYSVLFQNGKTFRFIAVDSEETKRRVQRCGENDPKSILTRVLIVVVHGNEHIHTLVNRIGNHIRTFFAAIKRQTDKARREIRNRCFTEARYSTRVALA
jgi:hypothetical protein